MADWRRYLAMYCRGSTLFLLACLCTRAVLADVTPQQVRADWAALQAAERDFDRRVTTLTQVEADDYRAYIRRLQERLAKKCARLTAAGVALPAEVSCPQEGIRVAPAAIDQQREQTPAEATSALDAKLGAGLGEFDQRLLVEQERVKAKASKSAGAGAGGGGGGAGAGSGTTAAGAGGGTARETATGPSSGASGSASDGSRERPAPGAAGGPGGGQTTASSAPPDIPDGSDDDVVARQLREAAETETDPELKKKLWEEYRKYKKGTR
jgi:hypothetical protein